MGIKVSAYKGMRDFTPEVMIKRNYVIGIIERIFRNYGFDPIETPAIELWETLSGKYGDEEKLLYTFEDRGKRRVGLRYDLTVPFSRFVANHLNELPRPFKRYQIQPVWRADRPQKGRFREFYQCDIDIIGVRSTLADAEILKVLYSVLIKLGFKSFTININSRKIFNVLTEYLGEGKEKEFLIARAIDKLDKIGIEGVKEELKKYGFSDDNVKRMEDILGVKGTNAEKINSLKKILEKTQGFSLFYEEINELINYAEDFKIPTKTINFNPFLARGLDYYTGPIFETTITSPKIGSITGGGRYDNLIGIFSNKDIPATGSSIGLERIITVMDELNMYPFDKKTYTDVLVAVQDKRLKKELISLTEYLRENEISTELYIGNKDLRGQINYALKKGINLMIIMGENELKENTLNLKILSENVQIKINREDLLEEIKNRLK